MVPDSLYQSIPNKEFSDSLFRAVGVVGEHTDSMSGFSAWVTIVSFIAAFVTIVGLTTILIELNNRRVAKQCQEKIILDLIRHFFINNAISEAIRIKLDEYGEGAVLREGIMQRYCVLDSDVELGQLSFSSKNYEQLHSLRTKLRNYNISAIYAEKHFTDPSCPNKTRIEDLDDILKRTVQLTDGFLEFAETRKMKIDLNEVKNYIRNYYESESRIPKWDKEGKINHSVIVPERPHEKNRDFYDSKPYKLKDIEDTLIQYRYGYAAFEVGQKK